MTIILTALIFLVTVGLCVSGLYFLVEAPGERRKFRARLMSLQTLGSSAAGSLDLLREETFSEIPAFNWALQRLPLVRKLQVLIAQAGMDTSVGTVLLVSFAAAMVALLVALIASMPGPMALMLAAGGGALPLGVVLVKRDRRFARFEELFPDAIELLARAVRAGHAFTTGFELIANETPEPVASEFRIAYEQQNLGMPLREALENLTIRVPIADVRFFVSALQIQRESGGNLAEILDKLSYVMRERFKILRQVQVFTAEARASLYILTAVPPLTGLFMYIANRDYIMALFQDPLGQKMVTVAVLLQVTGFFVMRQLTRLKV